MKPKQKLLALVVVLVIFAVGGAVATSFAAGDEESIYNWGSWGTMVTPAAGPAPALVVQLPGGTDYQPPVIVDPQRIVEPPVIVEPPPIEPPVIVEPPPIEPPGTQPPGRGE